MNKFGKYVLTALGLNFLSFVLLFIIILAFSGLNEDGLGALIIAFVIGVLSLLVQLIIALVYIVGEKKELGKAMLLSTGIILLIGLSVCSQG
jgi:uncharacterized membrane protein (DUF485 family)